LVVGKELLGKILDMGIVYNVNIHHISSGIGHSSSVELSGSRKSGMGPCVLEQPVELHMSLTQ